MERKKFVILWRFADADLIMGHYRYDLGVVALRCFSPSKLFRHFSSLDLLYYIFLW